MFKRIKARFYRPQNENAEWEMLHRHGYKDVPRHVSQALQAGQGRRSGAVDRHYTYGLTRSLGGL